MNHTLFDIGSGDDPEGFCASDIGHIVLEFDDYAYSPSGPGFAIQISSGKDVL